jgi:cystathionine beta-synthase
MVVLGAGTGGTITGVGRKLKTKCPNIKVHRMSQFQTLITVKPDVPLTTNLQYSVATLVF